MIRGTSYTIDLIFNAEYDVTRVKDIRLTIGNYDVCSLADGISNSGQHFLCSIPSDITAVLPVGERSVTLTIDDTTDGIRKAIIATIPIQNTGSQYENENISETANMTLELTYMVNNISADLLITDVTALRAIAAAAAAKVSEDNAKISEDNAKQSETNAAQSEINAATSESNASTSAANALTSEQNAATSEQNAATSEQNAATSEANALSHKSTAESAASTATTQAGISTSGAQTATTKAGEASQDAADADAARILAEEARDASIAKVGATVVDNLGVSTANAISQRIATNLHFTDSRKLKITRSTNRLNPAFNIVGKYLGPNGVLTDTGTDYSTTGLFEWGLNTQFVTGLNGAAAYYFVGCQYDANGAYLSRVGIGSGTNGSMTKDTNAFFFAISYRPAFCNQINFGTSVLPYEAYWEKVIQNVDGTPITFKPDMTDSALLLALDGGIVRTDLSLLPPKKIYNVFNDIKGVGADSLFDVRSHGATLHFDHLVNGITEDLDVNFTDTGNEKIVLFAPELTTPTSTVSKTIAFDKSKKYNAGSVTVIQKNVKESVGAASFPRVLCIGDSVTDGYLSQVANKSGLAQQYWSVIKEQFEQAKIDASDTGHNFLSLGHQSSFSWNMTYGGVTNRAMKAFAEGFGGWSTPSHLFWSRDWQVRGEGLWDLMGRCGTATAWASASTAQKNLMYQTPEGKYAPIDTAAFLAYINSELSLSLTTYAQAVSALNSLEANPTNPFYDYATASAGGSTVAFSMLAYLNRYKTLANDGTTRLVVGSTAGSKVTNVTAYDVCLPTHIIIQHSHNDGDVTWFADNMKKWTDAIKAEYTAKGWGAPFIGLSVIRHTGTYYPKRYPMLDRQYCSLWNTSPNIGYNNTQRLISKYWVSDANEDTEKIYILPSMHIQPTAWAVPFRHVDSPEFDITGLSEHMYHVIDGTAGTWHPNALAHRCWGMQMYAWIRWTLSL